jgi:hypothetical protein
MTFMKTDSATTASSLAFTNSLTQADARLVAFEEFDNFKNALQFPPDSVPPDLVRIVKQSDERETFEPFVRSVMNALTPDLTAPPFLFRATEVQIGTSKN